MKEHCTTIFFQPNTRKTEDMFISHLFVPVVTGCIPHPMKPCGVVWEAEWKTTANTTSLFIPHQHDSFFVNLFIASELNWKNTGSKIKQQTNFPFEEKTRLIITKGSSTFTLLIRYPSWVKAGCIENSGEW